MMQVDRYSTKKTATRVCVAPYTIGQKYNLGEFRLMYKVFTTIRQTVEGKVAQLRDTLIFWLWQSITFD